MSAKPKYIPRFCYHQFIELLPRTRKKTRKETRKGERLSVKTSLLIDLRMVPNNAINIANQAVKKAKTRDHRISLYN